MTISTQNSNIFWKLIAKTLIGAMVGFKPRHAIGRIAYLTAVTSAGFGGFGFIAPFFRANIIVIVDHGIGLDSGSKLMWVGRKTNSARALRSPSRALRLMSSAVQFLGSCE